VLDIQSAVARCRRQLCAYSHFTNKSELACSALCRVAAGICGTLCSQNKKKEKGRPARKEGAPKGARCLLTPVQRHVTFVTSHQRSPCLRPCNCESEVTPSKSGAFTYQVMCRFSDERDDRPTITPRCKSGGAKFNQMCTRLLDPGPSESSRSHQCMVILTRRERRLQER
jgi:hypothetical protein